jgi:segregation and condensation protein A
VPLPKVEGVLDLSGINLIDLTNGAQEIFFLANQKRTLGSVVVAPRITIRDKIQHIASMLRRQSKTTFAKLVAGRRSRLDIVVTFLALLELIKRQLVFARQDDTFGEIALESAENWTYEEDMETEFGE